MAQPYYRPASARFTDECPYDIRAKSTESLQWRGFCAAPAVGLLPYVDGLGWSKPGTIWLVTWLARVWIIPDTIQWSAAGGQGPSARYRADRPTGRLIVDGEAGTGLSPDQSTLVYWEQGVRVFQVPFPGTADMTVHVEQIVRRLPEDSSVGGSPASALIVLDRRMRLATDFD